MGGKHGAKEGGELWIPPFSQQLEGKHVFPRMGKHVEQARLGSRGIKHFGHLNLRCLLGILL